uniref:Uncharacterized protein n=1 Tax=uncultured marine virus TaxID=186617 RepID=A0A0F7LB14_9VIRU|nr:hypothetical protein [uncultured marine virus]
MSAPIAKAIDKGKNSLYPQPSIVFAFALGFLCSNFLRCSGVIQAKVPKATPAPPIP